MTGENLQNTGQGRVEHRFVTFLRKCMGILFAVGSVLACLLMICLFGIGFIFLFKGLLGFFERGEISGPDVIVSVLHGLEFFFLAPLPFLVLLSLARFFRSFLNPNEVSNDESKCDHQLHRVKALVVNLMIASVATDLLGRSLQGVTIETALGESLVMLLLGAYWFSLELVCSRHARSAALKAP